MAAQQIQRLCIIGVGLIGGSLARALKKANAVGEIVGTGRNAAALETARSLGVIDRYDVDIASAIQDADIVVLAVPLGAMAGVLQEIAPHVTPDMVITDVGSAKGCVIKECQTVFGETPAMFVPGHPIAGTEQSGVEASFAELFQSRRVILTPLASTDKRATQQVRAMWETCGAQVVEMEAAHHDEVLAATSHLPHMLAYALVDILARRDDSQEIFDYAAGGFRDFTRIASSDPQMWHDICLANHDALVPILNDFIQDLQQLADAVRDGDSAHLQQTFIRAKQARDSFCSDS